MIPILFCKELEKALKVLLPYEIEQLRDWVLQFTEEKPELRQCLIYNRIIINKRYAFKRTFFLFFIGLIISTS